MPAIIVAAIAVTKQKPGGKDIETVFEIIVFVFD
jgi:hypothetical protein